MHVLAGMGLGRPLTQIRPPGRDTCMRMLQNCASLALRPLAAGFQAREAAGYRPCMVLIAYVLCRPHTAGQADQISFSASNSCFR